MLRFDQGAKVLVFVVFFTTAAALLLKFAEKMPLANKSSNKSSHSKPTLDLPLPQQKPRFVVNDELPDMQPVLRLKFEEGYGSQTLDQVSGQYANVSNAKWVEGYSGFALEFNRDAFVRMADSELLRISSGDSHSFQIDTLIKLTAPIDSWPGSYQTVISKEHDYILRFAHGHDEMGTGRVLSSIFFAAGIDQHVNAYLPDFSFKSESPYQGHEITTIDLSPGLWHKLSMAYSDRVLRLFINQYEISKTITDTESRSSSNDLFIGSHINGIDGFVGQIDEIRIFKR